MFELNLDFFSGPLQKLLELIEAKELQINRLSLAEITGDFMTYIKGLDNSHPRVIADFVTIATRLMLIKSKSLLPELELTDEEEKSIVDLEERLKLYKQFKEAEQKIKELWPKSQLSFSREYMLGHSTSIFYPAKNLTKETLSSAFYNLCNLITETQKQYAEHKIINFEEYVKNLIGRLGKTEHFSDLSKNKEREEVIILFLALLHLLKDSLIQIEQTDQFSDIIIKSNA